MQRGLSTVASTLACSMAFGQQVFELPPGSGDCTGAIHLEQERYGPTNAPRGFGAKDEASDGDDQSLYYFHKEHNVVWYKFTAISSGMLELDLIPVRPDDDIDFLLFKATGKDDCEKIAAKELRPIRTCISKVNPAIGGKTGLSRTAEQELIHGGPGDDYSKALEVKKGEEYYLAVDHFRETATGHTLWLKYEHEKIAEESPKNGNASNEQHALSIIVRDAITGKSLNANIEIIGSGKKGEPLKVSDTHIFSIPLKPNKSYLVRCDSKGYMYYSASILTRQKVEPVTLEINLEPIEQDKKITINDIYFEGDKAEILPSSNRALETLEQFMKDNPEIKVEIGGHVNAEKNVKRAQQLSEERAIAVYYYLILKDIDRDRMKVKGYGNTQMIYPEPLDESQSMANRRVEIRILSID